MGHEALGRRNAAPVQGTITSLPAGQARRFQNNAARLQLFALAYNLANLLRRLVLPKPIRGRVRE
jgi:hypothetical protein